MSRTTSRTRASGAAVRHLQNRGAARTGTSSTLQLWTLATEEDGLEEPSWCLVETVYGSPSSASRCPRRFQECRETCGGQGLKMENFVGIFIAEPVVQSTFEGDNNVPLQQSEIPDGFVLLMGRDQGRKPRYKLREGFDADDADPGGTCILERRDAIGVERDGR